MKIFVEEKWKTVSIKETITNHTLLEVSNYGRVRTTNSLHEENLLKGSIVEGYRCVKLKLFTPRSSEVEAQLVFMREQLSKLHREISPLRTGVKWKKKKDDNYHKLLKKYQELSTLREGIQKIYRKLFKDDLRERTINYSKLVHRLVAENFLPESQKKGMLVIHLDHNKLNNHFENLKWVAQPEATAHWQRNPLVIKSKRGRKGVRPNNDSFKLTETRVMLIKKKINEGKKLSLLAKQFNVTETQLLRIKRGINWGDVKAAS